MKSLLVKDLELVLAQKKYFVFVLLMGIILNFSSDANFVQGYLTMLCGIFITTTVAYDELDNGLGFLLLLPIQRSDYVKEKYLFGVVTTFCGSLIGILLGISNHWIHGSQTKISDVLLISVFLFSAGIAIIAFMLPFILKFGQEKGMYIFFGFSVGIFGIGYLFKDTILIKDTIPNMLSGIVSFLNNMNIVLISLIVLVVVFFLYLISCGISMAIMKKKEL